MRMYARLLAMHSLVAILPLTLAVTEASAQTAGLDVIASFGKAAHEGVYPATPVVFDGPDKIYGSTYDSIAKGYEGSIYALTRQSDGNWLRRLIHSFKGGTGRPTGPLVVDTSGNVYGTTYRSAKNPRSTVFELSPTAEGHWIYKTIFDFSLDGSLAQGLVIDARGNLYGIIDPDDPNAQAGSIFQLSPQNDGGWIKSVLYEDANKLLAGLTLDKAGNLYVESRGGATTPDYLYRLSRSQGGEGWTLTTVHSFPTVSIGATATDTYDPLGGIALDNKGNIYGVGRSGGKYATGAVFKIPAGQGSDGTDELLYSFSFKPHATQPLLGVNVDPAGNVYGLNTGGGNYEAGKILELVPQHDGSYTAKALHDFGSRNIGGRQDLDGAFPYANIIFGPDGFLYGTTYVGGYGEKGTVFKLVVHQP